MQKELVLTTVVRSKIKDVDYIFKSNNLVLSYTQIIEPEKPKKRNIVEINAPYFPQKINYCAKNCQNFCKQKSRFSVKRYYNQTTKFSAQNQTFYYPKNTKNFECLMALIIKFFL